MSDDKLDGKTGKSRRTRYPKEYQINVVKMVYEKAIQSMRRSGYRLRQRIGSPLGQFARSFPPSRHSRSDRSGRGKPATKEGTPTR